MPRFKVGDSSRSISDILGHHIAGGTWHTPEGVGSTEGQLKVQFPFLIWEGYEPKKEVLKEVPKPSAAEAVKPSITREELDKKAKSMNFKDFKQWASETYHVTGSSYKGIVDDILAGKKEI